MAFVRFKAGDLEIQAELIGESIFQSPHTGKDLLQMEVEFHADETERDVINTARCTPGAVLLRSGEPAEEIPITIEQTMHSFRVGRRQQVYKWTLIEKEDLKLEALELDGVVLTPYRFEEEVQNGLIHIEARVEVDDATREKLSMLPLYFPVIRRGFSETPVLMRFGQPLWSQTDSDKTKHRYVLVEERYDTGKTRGFLEPQFGNLRDSHVMAKAQLGRLLEVLGSKGLLSPEEMASILEVPEPELRTQHRLINRVDDIDEWLD